MPMKKDRGKPAYWVEDKPKAKKSKKKTDVESEE